MKKNFIKPKKALVFAVAAVLALSATAFAASQTIFNRLDTSIVEGEQYVTEFAIQVSEDETLSLWTMGIDADAGLVVADIEGETHVLNDPLVLIDVAEAQSLFATGHFMIPGYLPDGFQFDNATFSVNPRLHDQEGADGHLTVDFVNGPYRIGMTISAWDDSWAMPIMGAQEDIVINGHPAAIMEGNVMVLADGVLYTIFPSVDTTLSQDTLLAIAESLR